MLIVRDTELTKAHIDSLSPCGLRDLLHRIDEAWPHRKRFKRKQNPWRADEKDIVFRIKLQMCKTEILIKLGYLPDKPRHGWSSESGLTLNGLR